MAFVFVLLFNFVWFHVPFAHDLCLFVCLLLGLCVCSARFASLESLLPRFTVIMCMCMCLCTFFCSFKSCIQCMHSVVHVQCMHSRLCTYLYVCQHKMELTHTHTYRARDTPFLLHSSIALIKRIWNLSFFFRRPFPSLFFLFFCYMCIVRLRFALPFFYIVPFHLFISTVLLFAASDLPVATTISNRYILVLKYSYLCTLRATRISKCIRKDTNKEHCRVW